jgi:hypothetical protein
VNGDRPQIGKGEHLERQEGATFALCRNQFRYKPNPLAISRKTKGITLLKFFRFDHCRSALDKKRSYAIAQLYAGQRAC